MWFEEVFQKNKIKFFNAHVTNTKVGDPRKVLKEKYANDVTIFIIIDGGWRWCFLNFIFLPFLCALFSVPVILWMVFFCSMKRALKSFFGRTSIEILIRLLWSSTSSLFYFFFLSPFECVFMHSKRIQPKKEKKNVMRELKSCLIIHVTSLSHYFRCYEL